MISIIIPVYNAAKTIGRCVDSILAQTIKDYEIILVNDGSKDDSLLICKEYACRHDNIRIIDQPNSGVSVARNVGIDAAKGEFITFIDSDDFVLPSYLEDFNFTVRLADIYIQGIDYVFPHNNHTKHFFSYTEDYFNLSDNPSKVISSCILENGCPVAKLFKRAIIHQNNIRFNTVLSINEDHLFVAQYYTHSDSIYISDKINYKYVYDIYTSSLTKRKRPSCEWILVGEAMNQAFRCFIERYDCGFYFWNSVLPFFGLNQLIRATIAAYGESESKQTLVRINKLWRQYTDNNTIIIYRGLYFRKMSEWLSADIAYNYYSGKILLNVLDAVSFLKHQIRAIIYR